jgi:hypothetical protein
MSMSFSIEQIRAIRHMEGPALVLAGPGSGKTTVITQRILHLLRNGIPPEDILVITFTKAAAAEMEHRFQKLLADSELQNAGAVSGVVIEVSGEDGTIVQTVEGPVEFTVSKETDKSAVGGKVNPGDGVRVFFNKDGDALSLESMDVSINNPEAAVAAGEVILDFANNDFKSFAGKVQYPILIDGKEYKDAEALEKAKDNIWTPGLIKAVVTEDLLKTAAKDAGIFIGKDDGPYVLINNDMVFEISGIAVRKVVQN